MSVNRVILIGNLGKDPEVKNTQDGRELAFFSVATSESWKDKTTGERKEKTEWHRIAVYSQGLVEIVKKYVKKGTKVYVEGSLHTRKWVDKDGVEKYLTEIVLQNFNSTLQILSKFDGEKEDKNGEFNTREYVAETRKAHEKALKEPVRVEESDDEVPF